VDKTATNAYYDIEIDPKTQLPAAIALTVLTGKKGTTLTSGNRIIGGDHVAFHFRYRLSDYGKVGAHRIPEEAKKLLLASR
jgi:hypothetical protein